MSAREKDQAYEATRLSHEVTAQIVEYMRSVGMSRAALARSMGVTAGRVSQILSGAENLTLSTLAAVAVALDTRVWFTLGPAAT
jgi:plasmid maintenance system antidote protein VapI